MKSLLNAKAYPRMESAPDHTVVGVAIRLRIQADISKKPVPRRINLNRLEENAITKR